jgi:hypothetical protein
LRSQIKNQTINITIEKKSDNEKCKLKFSYYEFKYLNDIIPYYLEKLREKGEEMPGETTSKIRLDMEGYDNYLLYFTFPDLTLGFSEIYPDVNIGLERVCKASSQHSLLSYIIDKINFSDQEFEIISKIFKGVSAETETILDNFCEKIKKYRKIREHEEKVRNLQFAENVYGK